MNSSLSTVAAILVSAATLSAAPDVRLIVAAGSRDRTNCIVSIVLPPDARQYNALRDDAGRVLPLQVDKAGTACFVEPALGRGAQHAFSLIQSPSNPSAGDVIAREGGGAVQIARGGHPLLSYQTGKAVVPRDNIKPILHRAGYLHPIYSPAGRVVTDNYPTNHLHHHGVWFAWTKTVFEDHAPDFWNMGQGKGTVEFVSLGDTWSGPLYGGLRARHRYLDLAGPEPKPVLDEDWEVRVFTPADAPQPYWVFDLVITQRCASATALKLPEYYYGGVGFRGHGQWDGKDKAFFLTSEGVTDRVKGNATRGRWCHIGGRTDGGLAGVAILSHPQNFRAPQPMRLHPTEPFVCFAPSHLGDWEIAPGQPYVTRYRYVIADGPPDAALLDRLWNDYADPPATKWIRL
jgi:hypothetical protein